MIGMYVLLSLVFLAAVAVGSGFLAYRLTGRRWVQLLVTIIVGWLPFWDLIPGSMLFHKTVRELGGVRIYRKVQAAGYLDLSCTDCKKAWRGLGNTSYGYIEVHLQTPSNSPYDPFFNAQPGYYQFKLENVSEAECSALSALPHRQAKYLQFPSGQGIRTGCVISQWRAEPVSRYQSEASTGWKLLPGFSSWLPMQASWRKIVDRDIGEVIAEKYSIRYVSWIGRKSIGIPAWVLDADPSGRPFRLPIDQIVMPVNDLSRSVP